ncbi:DUF5709 domain-containing protein [Streptomyces sp. NPDC003077]|uniref:DUF5709 domain-containing protein n=1 Tax=Streptomyces sp. NPDC003077 TaxID=3154443 RepID=UPI0033B5A3B1
MSDDATGDEIYQPSNTDDPDNPDFLDMENSLDEPGTDELLDKGYSPPEKPLGVNRYGTTIEEQREGESLDQRLAEEVPDVQVPDGDGIGDQPGKDGEPVDDLAGEDRAGRLTRPDEPGSNLPSDVVGEDVGIDGGAASAEEAAVHRVDDDEL